MPDLNQSKQKLKLSAIWSLAFSHASNSFFALNSHWLIKNVDLWLAVMMMITFFDTQFNNALMPLDQCIKSSISLYPSTFRSSHSVLSWYPRSARSQWQTRIILRTQSRSSDIQLTVLPGNNFAAINCEFFNTSHPDHALIKNICFNIYLYFVFLRAKKRRGDKFVKQLRGCTSLGTTNNSVLSTELII